MKLRSIYPIVLVPLLSVLIIAIVLWNVMASFTHATPVPGRVLLPSTIAKYTSSSKVVAQTTANQPISLAIGLNLRNQADLTSYLTQISTPQSPLYHHYLNAATFAALYAPLPSSEAVITDYLRSQGFTITATYPNHLIVDARGTIGQAENIFQVQINNYQGQSGQYFFANAAAPSLPVSVASFVSSVAGLDNLVQYHRKAPTNGKAHPALTKSNASPNTITCPQPGAATIPTSYTPSQIATAYDFNKLYDSGSLGEGQTVGLLELDGYSSNDIALYASCFGGKNTQIQTIPIDGYNGAAGANAAEVELDMEMVLGLAPRLASLRVYEASISSLAAYNDAWARIVNDGTPVVSTSWVFCEQGAGVANEIQQENIFFQAAAAQGQTILAASGDLGATGCYDPQTGSNTTPSVDDPASQPFVTGVGGTTLSLNADNTYQSERVWNDRAIQNGASGGGVSKVWNMPSWQQGPGVANAYSTGYREVPDVSINADPQTGYDVYCSVGGCAGGGWRVLGGTSAAAPVWAAMVALANETALKANGYNLGFLNPSLYAISHGVGGTSYASSFHDIVPVQGGVNNNDYVGSNGTYPDSSMYDLATGLGSFSALSLTQSLLTLSLGGPTRTTATSTTWYFAEGFVGQKFQEYLTLENPDTKQAAQVQVQYLFATGQGPTVVHSVPPQSRATINVNSELNTPYTAPGRAVSMIVTSLNGVGIVAERPMYFSFNGINSGTDVLGSTQLGQDFYFADVESQRNYSSFITILNPPGARSANVTISYVAGGAQIATTTLVAAAGQRATASPMAQGVNQTSAVYVHSDQPIMVERPTYFSTSRSNINGPVTGANSIAGTKSPGKDWLFAEGYTGLNFHEYIVLANFDSSNPANVTVNLEYSNGATYPTTVTVAPQSQYFFDVNRASASFAQSTTAVSAEVSSDVPVVAQRQEYFRYNGTIPGGTDVIGQPGPAKSSYSFAEGYTGSGFSEYLTLQNPNTTSQDVIVRLYMANSITTEQVVTVGPQTRVTLDVNAMVLPIVRAASRAGYAVSLSVTAINGTIMAERPMYFNYHNMAQGGTDVVGYNR
ncbi:MAG TPA: peptidase S53 [Ktedonobacter sp.]|nr:peptidase S53 [Ktedonobacter sp.]